MRYLLLFLALLPASITEVSAHPMPNSLLLLDIGAEEVVCDLQLPLGELEMAWQTDLQRDPGSVIARYGSRLDTYIRQHMHPVAENGAPWRVEVRGMTLATSEQEGTGPYHELTVKLGLIPPPGGSTRRFTLHYDVIMHQLVTHRALVVIRHDWENGIVGEAGADRAELGLIEVDTRSGTIPPLAVNLEEGSGWQGFVSMVRLGVGHIAEGTDHLLFLLVLLLPAPLLAGGGEWGEYGGMRYSVMRLVRITAAFTVGHSITLLAGTLGWLRLPSQPVEVVIALSILVTAVHAVRPLFAGREGYVAAGFGLVHGLGFAGMLGELPLAPGELALGILGFNLGIEAMQLLILLVTVPWLIVLATTSAYRWIRIGGAVLASIAALAWVAERVSGERNAVSAIVERGAEHGVWLVLALALTAVGSLLLRRYRAQPAEG